MDRPGDLIERKPFRSGRPIRVDLKRIAGKARQDMQVDMENILKGGLPIGKKEIYALTVQI
jgi:hypothetical protein